MTAAHDTGFTRLNVDPFAEVPAEPGAAKPDPILVIDGVRRRFGGITAVDVNHLEVQRGAVTALIGPNGAGKTTFFNLLTGFDKSDGGTWSFNGDRLDGMASYVIARRGVVRTFQLTKALARMTVIENVKLGAGNQAGERFLRAFVRPLWRDQEAAIEAKADELLERFNLTQMRDTFAGELSGGQRKLLEMARALMTDPTLVMLDEPMAGVNPALAETIVGHVGKLRDDGLSVVFVEHDMDVVRTISDWVVVMGEGEVIAEGKHDAIVTNPRVIDAYLGAHHVTPLDRAEQDRQLAEAEALIVAELSEKGDLPDPFDGCEVPEPAEPESASGPESEPESEPGEAKEAGDE